MAKVIGQIESLKNLRYELDNRNIDLFNSVNDINKFKSEYPKRKNEIIEFYKNEISFEIQNINLRIKENSNKIPELKEQGIEELDLRIENKKKHKSILENKKVRANFIYKWFLYFKIRNVQLNLDHLIEDYDLIVENSFRILLQKIQKDSKRVEYLSNSRELELKIRSNSQIQKLKKVRLAIDELKPIIAGAIGESLVEKEIRKLSDEYILINNFKETFNPPIYNKRTNDRIYSIQIDHLLISRSGIFILETKNWSQKSINSLSLRSPVDQIQRTNFAIFILVNNSHSLNYHHWGEKQIPIRNVIVMINSKPNQEFKHVKIKLLRELNNYIEYFDPIFSNKEVENIASSLSNHQY
ncbi:nuclease-related domain-containing protein [Urechidicola vernalis]|uniref:Nuclease-related domain-containing protein n=1 Tax=Urechidicola vernalis TaxID=3075600 RepID=A0ABU2Y8U5_9FLAO|nr:nuclease-related domain-containing protein [Urechidicola sp. P050]MDT0554250.1 nuclease-related domain-containing protein [Urechidicola sp. P050]